MDVSGFDPEQTRLLSTFLTKMGEQRGYLVRIYPVDIGEGIIALPMTPVVLGRDSDCDLVVADFDISRRHATIEVCEGEYTIRDLNSTNGTLVNNRKVEVVGLVSGDMIRVGKTILKFLRGNDIERQYHETVYSMMVNDGLTGIPNKRFFQEALQRELARTQRHHRPLSLAVLDVDHFKSINDKFGHLAGDAVLRELCARIRGVIRKDEVFARYGGEEFVVLMPESTLEQASQFAERLRVIVQSEPVRVEGASIPVTVSIGVAHTTGEDSISTEELIERADRKLYDAKHGGRNKVMW